jgi:glycerol-3-phosphate dehydrogenase subunit C
VQQGFDVVVSCTSCSLTLKNEYVGVLGLDEERAIASHVYDLGDYLRTLHKAGELDVQFDPVPRKLAYHMPCHLHAQGLGLPLVELLNLVPELEVEVLDAGCCGLAGSFGFKHERYEASMAVGEPLFKEVREVNPEAVLSECGGCRLQIQHGTGKHTEHPVAVLRQAYGPDWHTK